MVSESNERSMAAVAEKVPRPCCLRFQGRLPHLRPQRRGGFDANASNPKASTKRLKSALARVSPLKSEHQKAEARFPYEKRASAFCI